MSYIFSAFPVSACNSFGVHTRFCSIDALSYEIILLEMTFLMTKLSKTFYLHMFLFQFIDFYSELMTLTLFTHFVIFHHYRTLNLSSRSLTSSSVQATNDSVQRSRLTVQRHFSTKYWIFTIAIFLVSKGCYYFCT